MLVWYEQPLNIANVIELLNHLFFSIFVFEAIFKIIALRQIYFLNNWNIFDFSIVALTLLMTFLEYIKLFQNLS